MSVIPELRRLRKENHEFEDSLVYMARPCLKKTKSKQTKTLRTVSYTLIHAMHSG
jgi:hypothetical protein